MGVEVGAGGEFGDDFLVYAHLLIKIQYVSGDGVDEALVAAQYLSPERGEVVDAVVFIPS